MLVLLYRGPFHKVVTGGLVRRSLGVKLWGLNAVMSRDKRSPAATKRTRGKKPRSAHSGKVRSSQWSRHRLKKKNRHTVRWCSISACLTKWGAEDRVNLHNGRANIGALDARVLFNSIRRHAISSILQNLCMKGAAFYVNAMLVYAAAYIHPVC